MLIGTEVIDKNSRTYFEQRRSSMILERSSFMSHWTELAENFKPRRGRFFTTDRNKGTKKYQSIINSTGTRSLRIATSGMLAGTMSPTRPWFALETQDLDLMERHDVKMWLADVEQKMRSILNSGNFYGMAPSMLSELIMFGTGAIEHADDFEDVARFYTHTVGSFMIALNDRLEVDTFARDFDWTVAMIVKRFGYDACSTQVKSDWDRSHYDNWHTVAHIIEPNPEHKPQSGMAKDGAFRSVYYERTDKNDGRQEFTPLSLGGFKEFPMYCPRWETTGEDIYGTDCPGMTSLGDVKGLTVEEKRKAQAIDKMVNPPLHGPANIRNTPVNNLPGGLTTYDMGTTENRLAPIYMINPQIQELRADITEVEKRIENAHYVDLFMAISTMEGIQPRNQLDLTQRNEERLLQLGPVLEQLEGGFLDPMLDRLFSQMARAGILPPPPSGLEGSTLKIKYISTLAMAQRAVATQNIDRLAGFVGGLAEIWPGASEKFDSEQAVDEYARAVGAPPSVVVPDDVLLERREERAQKQQAQEALAMAEQAAGAAKTASEADLGGDSVLKELTQE